MHSAILLLSSRRFARVQSHSRSSEALYTLSRRASSRSLPVGEKRARHFGCMFTQRRMHTYFTS